MVVPDRGPIPERGCGEVLSSIVGSQLLLEHVVLGDLGPEALEQQDAGGPDALVRHRRRVQRDPHALLPAQLHHRRRPAAAGRRPPRPCQWRLV